MHAYYLNSDHFEIYFKCCNVFSVSLLNKLEPSYLEWAILEHIYIPILWVGANTYLSYSTNL